MLCEPGLVSGRLPERVHGHGDSQRGFQAWDGLERWLISDSQRPNRLRAASHSRGQKAKGQYCGGQLTCGLCLDRLTGRATLPARSVIAAIQLVYNFPVQPLHRLIYPFE